MFSVRLALDWVPNTLHAAFYCAQAAGRYQAHDLKAEFLSPDDHGYVVTPARRLLEGTVDFALAPTESVLSYLLRFPDRPFVALSAVSASDESAVVALASSSVQRPRDLDGRRYGSYGARFENGVVRALVLADGGRGEIVPTRPHRCGVWSGLVTGESDAAWVFLPWEGLEAERAGLALRHFRLSEFGIPYGYSPVLLARREFWNTHRDVCERFLAATAEGAKIAEEQPEFAAEALRSGSPACTKDLSFLAESMRRRGPYVPVMEKARWHDFLGFLARRGEVTPEELSHCSNAIESDELLPNAR